MLLVMDMINDLIHPDGIGKTTYAPSCSRRNVYENTVLAIRRARELGILVGYVRIGFSPGYPECPPDSPVFGAARDRGILALGTWGTEVYHAFQPEPGDPDIVKHRVSPFYGTALAPLLSARKISRILLTGVSTNGVVSAAVREGHDRDLQCVVIEDCCAGANEEEHAQAIAGLRRYAAIATAASY